MAALAEVHQPQVCERTGDAPTFAGFSAEFDGFFEECDRLFRIASLRPHRSLGAQGVRQSGFVSRPPKQGGRLPAILLYQFGVESVVRGALNP